MKRSRCIPVLTPTSSPEPIYSPSIRSNSNR